MVIGIIGTGNIGALYAERLSQDNDIIVFDPAKDWLEELCVKNNYVAAESALDLAKKSDIVFVAVKPGVVLNVLREIAPAKKTVISTAAAVDEQCYYEVAGEFSLFRIMPTMVNRTGGPIMLVYGKYSNVAEQELVAKLLGRVGNVYVISEREMNAYMCVMSCSPAVFAEFVRQYVESFCLVTGIDNEKALDTVLDMIEHLAPAMRSEGYALIPKVCTPGGISEVGVGYLVDHGEMFSDMACAMLKRTDEICETVRKSL